MSSFEIQETQKEQSDNKLKCELCNFVTLNNQILDKHIRNVHQLFLCAICDYKGNRKWNYDTHMNKHTGKRKFKCDLCSFVTLYQNSLYTHKMNIHNYFGAKSKSYEQIQLNGAEEKRNCDYATEMKKRKSFECNYCAFVTVHKSSLNKHVQTVHTNSTYHYKKFTCEICKLKTESMAELRRHVNKHTEENKFECDLCDFVTLYKSSLMKHTKNIHYPHLKNRKTFECDLCDYTANRREHLERHRKKHSIKNEFQCEFCSYVNVDKVFLRRHEKEIHKHSTIKSKLNKETSNIKVKQEILEVGPIELQFEVKNELVDVAERVLPDI